MWVAEDLELVRVYYQRGNVKNSTLTFEVKDPPTSGWQNALLIRGKSKTTIFCPYSLMAWTVSNKAAEITEHKDIYHNHADFLKIQEILTRNWDMYQELGMQKNYDVAALIFKKLGVKAPEQKLKGGEIDTRKKGGQEVDGDLKKPVKLSSKRGKFLEWFLEEPGYSRPVREAMAEFGMSRSNALSYLYMLTKDHGIGYELTGDNANIMLPKGCSNPFDVPWGDGPVDEEDEEVEVDDDESWLD